MFLFSHYKATGWAERLYGLSCLAVDLNLVQKVALEREALRLKKGGKDLKEDKDATHLGSKHKALEMKAQAKHPVWHAYRMYSDQENLAREWLIHDTTRPVQLWYHKQCDQLRGVESTFQWVVGQCQAEYWGHLLSIVRNLDSNANFGKWGILLDMEQDTHFEFKPPMVSWWGGGGSSQQLGVCG